MEILQIINNFVFAKVIDILINVSQGKLEVVWIYYVISIFFAITVISTILSTANNYARRMLGNYSYPKFQELLYKKLEQLGIETLEQPDVNNLIARTQQNWQQIRTQFESSSEIISIITSLITTGVIIISFAPQLVPLILLVSLPYVYFDRKYQKYIWGEDKRLTEDRRAAYDSSSMLQDTKTLNELFITKGRKLLEKKFTTFAKNWYELYAKARSTFYKQIIIFRTLRAGIEAYADYLIIFRFINKAISIGDVTFYFRTISSFGSNVQGLSDYFSSMFESALRVKDIRELFEMSPRYKDGAVKSKLLSQGPEIEFKDVSFTYPESDKKVIKNLNLHIKSGEKLAVVGHNGAGKTTLVKLICRFYQVTEGELLINKTDINDLQINSWYKNLGVLFQDYNTYPHLTAKENIMIGKLKSKNINRLINSAKRADAHGFIKEFENGYDQVLSEKYKGGVRPSTGQWQKLAIARFFYRNAPLVIFDEPTAAIDAISEKKIFNKIYKFFEGKTVIIISHRFSTVRNADRIIVFEKGQIVEHGSHEELMRINGVYAKGFKLQAEGYRSS